ncbi:phenazine biosynthesis protein PhzF family [Lutibacter oricola]|uniref:Phenazine biosynthesis protein PhzF family n=1 Tax=Lutibacter oricola TaxID=762486 RepID=A0A1H2W2T5_9FLAO|nr:PhzF family phenazine biosynthesis protein [Lutibacter oricola]SDW74564.1 phenazine biosynthesis protein PhzF family [Lutibacter oricola]
MTIYQVDAFNNQLFKGNPAAVIPLTNWISDELMQAIAEENNLSETVYFVKKDKSYEIRWFTPTCEIDLCGHATLAAAHIIYSELNYAEKELIFNSKSGDLIVQKKIDWYTLNFPSEEITEIETPTILKTALNVPILKTLKGKWKMVAILENEDTVENLTPNFSKLCELKERGIIVTAKGKNVHFVSRFFAPKIGINEDPVTGSAHTLLIPYWAKKLNETNLNAVQLSKRRGILNCTYLKDRVEMSGQAITYLKGKLTLT